MALPSSRVHRVLVRHGCNVVRSNVMTPGPPNARASSEDGATVDCVIMARASRRDSRGSAAATARTVDGISGTHGVVRPELPTALGGYDVIVRAVREHSRCRWRSCLSEAHEGHRHRRPPGAAGARILMPSIRAREG